jgi:hypothetical protein
MTFCTADEVMRNVPKMARTQGWLFAMAKSIFAGTVEKIGKNR